MRLSILICLTATLAVSCSPQAPAPADTVRPAEATSTSTQAAIGHDQQSYAMPDTVRISDLALSLNVDFQARQLGGTATYALDWVDPSANQLVLDTRDLAIEKVVGERPDGRWDDLKFEIAPAHAVLGSKLSIRAPRRNPRIRVTYTTSPEASGLRWLTPELTADKRGPLMFSKSRQIHARSWVPLQDTPGVRFTYTAHVTSSPDTMVVMGAGNDPEAKRDGDYAFQMPLPVPSYLLAIAAGDLVFQPISRRAGVWTEPSRASRTAAEFADTERMMRVAEQLYGPYRWGRYDTLALPPSLLHAGMKQSRQTVALSTVMVAKQSLIAHELAQSWSGTLVTFAASQDAWLNEGFTDYIANRIIEELYGKERAENESEIGRDEPREDFKALSLERQASAMKPEALPDLDGSSSAKVHPKGARFMDFLEQRFGRENLEAFLRGYLDEFAFQSITTATFVNHLTRHLLEKYPGKVTQAELEEWIYQPGVPESASWMP